MRKILVAALLCGVAVGQEVPQGNPTMAAGTFSGKASFVPWSGSWWPMKTGELGLGWDKKSFVWNGTKKKYELKSNVATKDLSPLAKYDKYVGNPLDSGAAMREITPDGDWMHYVDPEKAKEYKKDDVDYSWWGHCNGWAAACALEDEPVAPIEKNGVYFEVADLKGLLSESHFGVVSPFSGSRYGKPSKLYEEGYPKAKELLAALKKTPQPPASEYRAWYEKVFEEKLDQDYTPNAYKGVLENFITWYDNKYTKAYEDIRPDVFHKILTQIIGTQKQVVVFDITAGEAVWNYPAFSYSTTLVDKGTKWMSGNFRRIWEVKTSVTYADDAVGVSDMGTKSFTKNYTYELYTTAYTKKLKGGKWLGGSVDDHPDFAWFPKFNPTGTDDEENNELIFGKILEILPSHHFSSEAKPFQILANGTNSESRRSATSPVTWQNPVTSGSKVTLTYQSTLTDVVKVKFFEQKVSTVEGGRIKATRDALITLGEMSATPTMSTGKHMIVAYAYDAAGKLLAVDEITVNVQ